MPTNKQVTRGVTVVRRKSSTAVFVSRHFYDDGKRIRSRIMHYNNVSKGAFEKLDIVLFDMGIKIAQVVYGEDFTSILYNYSIREVK